MADYRIRITVDPSGAVSGSQRATTAIERIGQAADKVNNNSVDGLMEKLRGIGTGLKIGLIIAGVVAFARVTDGIKQANSQIKLATNTQAQFNAETAKAYTMAQKQGVAYGATATLLAKTLKAANNLGLTSGDAIKKAEAATATVLAGIRVSGTSSEAAAAGVFQLSQALASGTLRGDELNSVLENIPAVGDAIAKAMGLKGGAGALRAMGSQGKLASAEILNALAKAQPEIERLAAMIPLTFSAAFQKVKNAGANLLSKIDAGGGISSTMIAGLDALATLMDKIAANANLVGNVITGMLVAGLVRAGLAAKAAGMEASKLAAEMQIEALSAHAAAVEELRLAEARVAAGRVKVLGGGGGAALASATIEATKAVEGLAKAEAGVAAATELASAKTGLFGRAFVAASGVARTALALVGGPIGVVVAALVALGLWAGKAALSFKPIAGSAAEVRDYASAAFDVLGDKVSGVIKSASDLWAKYSGKMYGYVRSFVVSAIDFYLSIEKPIISMLAGLANAFKTFASNVGGIFVGIAADIADGISGGAGGHTAKAISDWEGVWDAAKAGAAEASSFMGDITGENIVSGVERGVKAIPGMISDAFKSTGLQDKAEEYAHARAEAAKGGLGGPGEPATPKEKKQKGPNFPEILKEAQEAAKVAGMQTAEADRMTAIYAAQKSLKRDLTKGEKEQLSAAIDLKRVNEANLDLEKATYDVNQSIASARVKAAADEARDRKDFSTAAALEAELLVLQRIDEAKRNQTPLDAAKVEAYRQSVNLAAQETEIIRQQEEARKQLQGIADKARDSIRTAVSDAIYEGLSGNIKSVKGLFKTIGDVYKRALADELSVKLFASQTKMAKVDSARVTKAAVDLTTPAAAAIKKGGEDIAEALSGVAGAINNAAPTGSAANDNKPIEVIMKDPIAATMGKSKSSIGDSFMSGIKEFNGKFKEQVGGLADKIGKKLGILDKAGGSGLAKQAGQVFASAQLGQQAGSMATSLLGIKGSSTGGMLGGAIGGAFGGPLGAAIGGAIGSAVLGAFKKAKTGSVTVSGGNGTASASDATGNNKKMKEAASLAGDTITDRLNAMAKALGAGIGSFGNIQVGQRDGKWRVNENGTSLKVKKGAVDFGEDAEGAVEYAIELAIKRGAFTGLSQGINDALKAGTATAEEAISFIAMRKSVDRSVKALTDPIGASIDELNDTFNTQLEQYKKFGESTVNLEKLYQDQRAKIIAAANAQTVQSTKDLLAQLKGGDLGGASKIDAFKQQDTAFASLEQTVKNGGVIDYDQLNKVGEALVNASKELEGGNEAFYSQVDRVAAVLQQAIDRGSAPVDTSNLPAAIDFNTSAAQATTDAVVAQTDALTAALNALGVSDVRNNAALIDAINSLKAANTNTVAATPVAAASSARRGYYVDEF